MHLLGIVLIPFDRDQAAIRPLAARDAAAQAQLDILLFRYEQPEEWACGVDDERGFKFDWCVIGGRSLVSLKEMPSGQKIWGASA